MNLVSSDLRPSRAGRAASLRPVTALVVPALFLSALAIMWLPASKEGTGGLALLSLLLLLALKVPVGPAMALVGTLGIVAIGGTSAAASTLSTLPFRSVASWSLSVIPMFILMGIVLWRSGITERVYGAVRIWSGRWPGGLALGTNFAGAGLAAASGSTLGVTYALTRVGVPEMLKAGYDRRVATASVLMAGSGGQLIPPSVLLVVYAGVASVPVGPQLMAGLVPGVILTLGYGAMLTLIGVLRPSLMGQHAGSRSYSWWSKLKSLHGIWPIPLLMAVVLGGLYQGYFTATEAGAVGALGSTLLAAWLLPVKKFARSIWAAANDTAIAVASIFFLVIGAMFLGRFLTLSGLPSSLSSWIGSLDLDRVGFLVFLFVAYLIIGMFMEPLVMILVTVPVLLPTVLALDISLFWFGVFVVLLGELAIVTPPVGILTFVVHGIVQDKDVNQGVPISLKDVFTGVSWILPVAIGTVALIIGFPDLVDWLPNLMEQ